MAKKRKPRETEGMLNPKPVKKRKQKPPKVARKRAKRVAHRRRGG